jgi:hypothetical protein
MVKCLVKELGADVTQACYGSLPPHMAVQLGNLDLLHFFIEEFGADVNQALSDGSTLLFVAAQHNQVATLRYLKKLGANVDQASDQEATTLFIAAQEGHLNVLKYLVNELGADINKGTLVGSTPLMIASKHNYNDVVRWLLKKSANAQTKLRTLYTAADISKHYGAPVEATAYLKARTHCANPGCISAGLKKYAGCLEVFFCSKECQVVAWPAHKADVCKQRVLRQRQPRRSDGALHSKESDPHSFVRSQEDGQCF